MKNKSIITLLLSILLISVLIIAFSLSKKTETNSQSTVETSSVVQSNHRYPSLDKVKACQGADIQVLGKTQITTVLFQNEKIAILSPEDREDIQFPINITDKKNNLFEIPTLQYSPKDLKIGEVFGLAKKGNKYFSYQIK